MILKEIFENKDKLCLITSENGSRNRVKWLLERMAKGFDYWKAHMKQQAESGMKFDQREYASSKGELKEWVEKAEDTADEYLEMRKDVSKTRNCDEAKGGLPGASNFETKEFMVVEPGEENDELTDEDESEDDKEERESHHSKESNSSHQSSKSQIAKVKAQVAALRVKQEKKRYEMEQKIQQAKRDLKVSKLEDEAAHANLEADYGIEKKGVGQS
jgi:hypothetical protein